MVNLFARLPQTIKVPSNRTKKCAKLAREWQYYVVQTHALRKVFLSIKGIYYQAEVQGVPITWLTPYDFSQQVISKSKSKSKDSIITCSNISLKMPDDVDYRMMLTFLEFYTTLMGFVLFKLYASLNLRYPPYLNHNMANEGSSFLLSSCSCV